MSDGTFGSEKKNSVYIHVHMSIKDNISHKIVQKVFNKLMDWFKNNNRQPYLTISYFFHTDPKS